MSKIDLLRELGSCWRGDWSDFDGRTLRNQLNEWIELEDTTEAIDKYRSENGMCPHGNGYWDKYCSRYEESDNA